MTTPGKFAGLAERRAALTVVPEVSAAVSRPGVRPSRAGKKAIGAHFTPELCRAVNLVAVEGDSSVQAVLGEALDLLLRSRGKLPFGER
jgi:hypothetical protein